MFQVPQRQAQMSLLRSAFSRDSDSLNKHFAISHHSFSAISSAPPTFLNSKANLPLPFYLCCCPWFKSLWAHSKCHRWSGERQWNYRWLEPGGGKPGRLAFAR